MKKYRIRFIDEQVEDGIMAIEIVVAAIDKHGAVARASFMLAKAGHDHMTWIESVTDEDG